VRVKTEAKRQAILDIASEVFRELGFEAASMSEIAARLGGSKTTLYSYFKSKEEIFLEVLLASGERHGKAAFLELEESGDIRLGLLEFGVRHLEFITRPEPLAMLRLAIAEGNRSDLGRQFYERGPAVMLAELSTYLQTLIERKLLRDRTDAKTMALQLKALYEAEVVERQLFGDAGKPLVLDLRSISERAVDVFLAAYAAAEH
jgi:AcrR family transcriptional regulator